MLASYAHDAFVHFYEAQTCIHMCITVGISIYAKFWLRRALETERLPKPGSVHYKTYKNENELQLVVSAKVSWLRLRNI
jgi:hypothetical protein